MSSDAVRAREPLGIGERAPDFVTPGPSGDPARFYAHAGGRPTAVIFADAADPQAQALAAHLSTQEDVACCQIAPGPPDGTVWSDPDGKVAAAYGVAGDAPVVVVLDPNLRVAGVASGARLADETGALLAGVRHHGQAGQAERVSAQAPVLLLPRTLPPGWCERLIQVWHDAGGVETGVAREGAEELDDHYKRRRDHTVRDPDLMRELSTVVGRRVMPEVRKAFAYRASRFEGFKIACYDAGAGGFFRPHRDNLTPTTAHRVFALTLNLNDAYEGGELRFPEYGNQRYRPEAGAALVFSCSHLHEVLDVTAGRRFVLLSFLYGEPTGESR